MNRSASRSRSTKETTVSVDVNLDGTGVTQVSTGLPFFDHMLTQLGRHGGFDLAVTAEGDLEVDAHHTVEDVGLALGACVSEALGEKVGVRRFASIDLPLDEALIAVALDLSGRPFLVYDVEAAGVADSGALGTPGFHPQLAEEFWRAFVMKAGITMHVRMLSGRNAHHILEATFKAVARALREAMTVDGDVVPSTKGVL